MLLSDRIALVTGAGSGLGRAVARAFAREGAFLLLLGRRRKKIEETYDLILQEGGKASILPLDLEKELPKVVDAAQEIARRFGQLHILVNNAAQSGSLTPLSLYDPRMWESLLRVNVTAPFFLIQRMMPLLEKSGAASVINVTSGAGVKGAAFHGAYGASKAALINLTETWATELVNKPVRINGVDPGPMATAMRANAFPGEDPATLPTPEQLVPVFLYLASDHSREVRGRHLSAREWMNWRGEENQG